VEAAKIIEFTAVKGNMYMYFLIQPRNTRLKPNNLSLHFQSSVTFTEPLHAMFPQKHEEPSGTI